MNEIGSEFWTQEIEKSTEGNIRSLFAKKDARYLLSGRTAIDYVLQDIKHPIKKVYIPSYCCTSIIDPFLINNIELIFYDIEIVNGGINYLINYEIDIDIFFGLSYFGFKSGDLDNIILKMKKKNVTVIEDVTHRLLSKKYYCPHSDYYIASLRKWFPIPSGGMAVKNNDNFSNNIHLKQPPSDLINKKIAAMNQKEEYIYKLSRKESQFEHLRKEYNEKYNHFNTSLKNDYKNYLIDNVSLKHLLQMNLDKIRDIRQSNALELYNISLMENEYIKFLFPNFNIKEDCPLFVPIIIKDLYRDKVKEYFIKHGIYTPIHWPIPPINNISTITLEIYNSELSLVCDQRYKETDMKCIVDKLGEFFENV